MFTQLIRFNKEDSPAKVEEMFYKWASTFYTEKGFNGFAFTNNEDIGEYSIVVLWDSEEAAMAAAKSVSELQLEPVA